MPRKRERDKRVYGRSRSARNAGFVLMPEIIGSVLAMHRRRAGLRQDQLAYAADLPQSFVSKIERGDVNLSVELLDLLAQHLSTALEEGGERELWPWHVLLQANEVAQALMDLGYTAVWCPGPLWDQPAIRGRELRDLVPEDLPRDWRVRAVDA
ncbi:MAG: helix-turn-helix transcriptional regulator [Pseudomonadota bacterium]